MMQEHEQNAMITCNEGLCNEGINTPIICNDSIRLDKTDWWYLVQTLESWGVFKPRAIVKKNPAAAWKVMNLCKDRQVRQKGSYFTVCFRRELALAEMRARLGA